MQLPNPIKTIFSEISPSISIKISLLALILVSAFAVLSVYVRPGTITATHDLHDNYGLWTEGAILSNTTSEDNNPVNLGMKFQVTSASYVKGLRFYKGEGNTGTHIGALWDASGNKLAEVTFVNETATGMQLAYFPKPVLISANTTYVISYLAPNGHYAWDEYYWNNSESVRELVGMDGDDVSGNGVYYYSSSVTFPNNTYHNTNYWVDVIVSQYPI